MTNLDPRGGNGSATAAARNRPWLSWHRQRVERRLFSPPANAPFVRAVRVALPALTPCSGFAGGATIEPTSSIGPVALFLVAASAVCAISTFYYRQKLKKTELALEHLSLENLRLGESRALLDAILQTAPVVVSVKDEAGRIIMANAECARFNSCDISDVVGRTDADLYSAEQANKVRAQDIAALSSTGVATYTELFATPVDADRWVEKRKIGVTLPGGKRAVVTTLHDITAFRRAETEALEAREFLASIIDAVPHSIFVKDEQHRWVVSNKTFAEFVGTSVPNLLGKTDPAFFSAAESDAARAQDDLVFSSEDTLVTEQLMTRPGGLPVQLEKTKSLLKTASGKRFIVGLARDVTAERQAALALKESELRWSSIVSSATEGIVVTDDRGIIESANPALHRMFGFPPNALVGLSIGALMGSTDRQHHDAYMSHYRDGGVRNVVGKVRQIEGCRQDGTIVPIEISVSEFLAGGSRRLTGVLRDRSEETRRYAIARQTEQVAMVGGWDLDLISNSLYWTDETYRIHEVSPDGFTPTVESAIGFYTDEDQSRIRDAIRSAITTGKTYDELFQIRTGTGRLRWVRSVGNAVVRDGRAVKLYGAFQDVTDQTRMADELRLHRDHLQDVVAERTRELVLARDAAESASRAKTVFLANMSHEFRTPLHAMLSYSALAVSRAKAGHLEKTLGFVEKISVSAQRLSSLLDAVFDVISLESESLTLRKVPQDLRVLSEEAASRLRPLAMERGVVLHVPEEFASCWSMVDRDRMIDVVEKLLLNAIQFSPPEATVRVLVQPSDSDATLNCISVVDAGRGVPASELESIFGKFVQGSNALTGAGGRGLGLAICRLIVNAHGGDIRATNNAPTGACFRVLLPRLPDAESVAKHP